MRKFGKLKGCLNDSTQAPFFIRLAFGWTRPVMSKNEYLPLRIESQGATYVLINWKQGPAFRELAIRIIIRRDAGNEIGN